MGAEKERSKSSTVGSFFHLLDWRKKARKRLFSTENDLSVRTNDRQQHERVDESEMEGASSVNEGSEYSCSSSLTDHEGHGIRAPGVIARLMGLVSMPTSGISEPCSTPLHLEQPVREGHSPIRSPEMHTSDRLSRTFIINDKYTMKQVEMRSQRMPSSPIEKFQKETLPPRSAKASSVMHHKLLSPVRHAGFISAKNPSLITEAANRILESELQNDNMSTSLSVQSPFNSSKVHEERKTISASKTTSKLSESSRRATALGSLGSLKRQPFNESRNGFEDTTIPRSIPGKNDTSSSVAKVKDKSISLALQAKINVQRRENLSIKSRDALFAEDIDEHKCVLRQTNQKQNLVSGKSNLLAKPSASNQQESYTLSGNAYYGKKKVAYIHTENGNIGFRKEGSEAARDEKEGLAPTNVKFTRNRKLVKQECYSRRKEPTNDRGVARHGKQVRHNVVMDDHPRSSRANTINGSDVVSFTFTSRIRKSNDGPQVSSNKMERLGMRNEHVDTHQELTIDSDDNFSSLEPSAIEGDCLGKLIERKLRELTFGVHSPYKLIKGGSAALSSSVPDDSACSAAANVTDAEHDRESFVSSYDELCAPSVSHYCLNSDEASCMSYEPQEAERTIHFSKTLEVNELDLQGQFPACTIETAFSSAHCYPSESCGSSNGNEVESCPSSMVAQDLGNGDSMKNTSSSHSGMRLSDSFSNLSRGTSSVAQAADVNQQYNTNFFEEDLEYVKEIVAREFMFEDLVIYPVEHSGGILDPLIFDKLEENRSSTILEEVERNCKMRRKMLFDSVNDCLVVKSSHFFQAGYRSWAKAAVFVDNHLAEEIYKEISGWKSIGDWMTDELVDKDMSTRLGRWINFETEAFEAGIEIGVGILNSLLEELVTDLYRNP